MARPDSRTNRPGLCALRAGAACLLISLVIAVAGTNAGANNGNGNGDGSANGNPNASANGQAHSNGNAALTDPQPLSNADLNPGGANNGGDCGAYCSTRDGSPSENGNGDGNANGKPCAGCVGNADNKNPPGQQPDGSDGNNGYECDGNNGIGKTNPAHTGCTTTSTTTAPTTTTTVATTTTTAPTTTTTAAGATTTAPPTTAPAVLGVVVSPSTAKPAVAPATFTETELPRTGADYAAGMIAGLGLILTGFGGRRFLVSRSVL